MKKVLSRILSSVVLASAMVACAPAQDQLDPAITLASSDARANAEWLDERLDEIPDKLVIGMGSNEKYGIDMSEFEPDGYILRAMDDDVLIFGASEDGLDRAVRAYAKAADEGSTSQLDTVYHEGMRVEKLTIAGTDISEFTITYKYDSEPVLPNDALSPYQSRHDGRTFGNAKYAATELVRLIEQATGITLEDKPVTEKVSGPVIHIDYLDDAPEGYNGFTYEVKDGNLYINGGPDANGCANGVYYFLEHECGWEALLYGDSDLQEADLVEVPDGIFEDVDPMFDYWYFWFDDQFRVLDNDRSEWSRRYSGMMGVSNHGIEGLLDPGHELGLYAQLCQTADKDYFEVYDHAYSWLYAQTAAGNKIGREILYIDLGMADNMNHCICSECAKIYKQEGGVHSGAYVRFANRLVAEIEPHFPGLKWLLIAYHGTNIPCETAPADNVYITYATNGSCVTHPMDGSECTGESFSASVLNGGAPLNNVDYGAWLEGWADLTENLYVWHYAFENTLHSPTYFNHLYQDMQFFAENNVKGIFLNADHHRFGLGLVRFHLMSEIFWHPELSEEEYNVLRDEVLMREYGEGWTWVLDVINIWDSLEHNCYNCWNWGSPVEPDAFDVFEYSRRAEEINTLLARAYKLSVNAKQERSLDMLVIEALYKQCSTTYFAAYDAGDTQMLEYLSDQYDRAMKLIQKDGTDISNIPLMGGYALAETIEEAAWRQWYPFRDDFTPEGTEQKPAPREWIEYWETSK